jgi:hypothetical protein
MCTKHYYDYWLFDVEDGAFVWSFNYHIHMLIIELKIPNMVISGNGTMFKVKDQG